jgi:eukaryotic-like serine/threonine-protein kinase
LIGDPDIADLPSGYRFGNYVILERIGRGGMARVYRAEHVALNKHVALKVMDLALQDKTAAQRQFMREGRAAAAVKHPNVVDIADVGVWQGVPYLVMELLEGWDLETHLRERGPLPDGELVRLALPVIAGLAVAHDAGVVHRDLKPSNIFLARGADGDQVPKVLDFGISKLLHEVTDLAATPYGILMGTPLYLPPEALGGAQAFTPASDQYSLGVVLYECAVGKPPFQNDTLVALLQRIGAGKFEPPSRTRPDMSAVIERAILRAMHPDPRQRFSHVRELGRALWEMASPRTQVVWGRTFADASDAAPSVRTTAVSGRNFGLARQMGQRSSQDFSNTRQEFVSAPPAPARARSKRLWIAGGAVLVLAAAAGALLFQQSSGPRGEPMSSLLQPPEGEARASAALRPTAAPPASAAPPDLTPAPAAAAGPASTPARGKASSPDWESGGASRSRSADQSPKTARGRRRSGVLAPEPTLAPDPRASDQEFPGLLRDVPNTQPAPSGARARDSSVGANQSPILD